MSKREPLLAPQELMIPAVAKILAYFDEKLTKLRIANDSINADVSTRGRIAEIKDFQKAVSPKAPSEVTNRNSAI